MNGQKLFSWIPGMRRLAAITVLFLAAGCSDDMRPDESGVPLDLVLTFPAQAQGEHLEGGSDRVAGWTETFTIDSLVASLYTASGGVYSLHSRVVVPIDPGQREFTFAMAAPLSRPCRVLVGAIGTSGSAPARIDRGLVHAGWADAGPFRTGWNRPVEIAMIPLVPAGLTVQGNTIRWQPVPNAYGYRILEEARSGKSECFTDGLSAGIGSCGAVEDGARPFSAGDTLSIRVRAELPAALFGLVSAYSQPVTVRLPAPDASVAVTAPGTGDLWSENAPAVIAWSVQGARGDAVRIDLLRDGASCRTIAESTENDGEYVWFAAQRCGSESAGYQVRVTDLTTSASGTSTDGLRIEGAPCGIRIEKPAGGERFLEGSATVIRWSRSGECSDRGVRIDLVSRAGVCAHIADVAGVVDEYLWSPVTACSGEGAGGYSIRVTDAASGAADESPAFAIHPAPTLRITEPADGAGLREGAPATLRWTTSGTAGPTVVIDLLADGTECTKIAETENDGAFTWETVKRCGTRRDGYAIRIVDPTTGAGDSTPSSISIEEPSCGLELASPRGGESFTEGSSMWIRWTSRGSCGRTVRIELTRSGVVCARIAETRDGAYRWSPVLAPAGHGDGYRIRITDVSSGAGSESQDDFRIAPRPGLRVTAPRGDESWVEGSRATLRWASDGRRGGAVSIEILQRGRTCGTIAASTENDGEFVWDPIVRHGDGIEGYAIRIADAASGAADTTPAGIRIDARCALSIDSPQPGDQWEEGSAQVIRWSRTGACDGRVSIDLVRNGAVCAGIAGSTENDGEYPWDAVIQTGDLADGYRVVVTDLDSGSAGESGEFRITDPPCRLELTAPEPGVDLVEGTPQAITWSHEGECEGEVRIDLLRNGISCEVVTLVTENDGFFMWDSPVRCGSETEHYSIRIRGVDTSGEAVTAGEFRILGPPCGFEVLAPSGGERWESGSSGVVRWTTTGECGASVRIELLRDGSPCLAIVQQTENDGTYTWSPVRDCAGSGGFYSVRISDPETGASGDCNGGFSIETEPCSMTLRTPEDGDVLVEGTVRAIQWESHGGCEGNVKLELLHEGAPCLVIKDSTPDDGSFYWTVTGCGGPEDGYAVRITHLSSGAVDATESDLRIVPPPCELEMTRPAGGDSLTSGSVVPILWSSNHCGETVSLELLRDDVVCSVIEAGTGNDGRFDWIVTSCEPEGWYRVRVTDTASGSFSTSGAFTVTDRRDSIHVIYPNGGETLFGREDVLIRWSSSSAPHGRVRIELMDVGRSVSVIADSVPDLESYSWRVSTMATFPRQGRLRITNLSATAADESDGDFTVLPSRAPGPGHWIERERRGNQTSVR